MVIFGQKTFRRLVIAGLAFSSLMGAAFARTPDLQADLEASLSELATIRESIAKEKLPMVKGLNSLEDKLMDVRLEFQKVSRELDGRNLDLNNLRSEIKTRQGEKSYISNLLGEYGRNFETRLHIAELNPYREVIDAALLAPEKSNLSDTDVYLKQIELVEASIIRLQNAVGGSLFVGSATGEDGLVKEGMLALVGPVALFVSEDKELAGIAEQRLGSLEPTVLPFADPSMELMVKEVVANGKGQFPFDPSLGNARKIEETQETFKEHIQKGGFVAYVILGMFGFCVIISIFKLIELLLIPKANELSVQPVLQAMLVNDHKTAAEEIEKVKGPTGRMLKVGIEHIDEPKDLVEEVMYEEMLTARMKANRFTPVLAVCASSAPLLGLLGTVTGIINTFKLITVFGSGDVKTLSGGISEALITTELGLVVAIFSLFFYAILSRFGKSITDNMEKVGILFMNRATRSVEEAEASNGLGNSEPALANA